jgi:hypothetical protein
MSHFAKLDANNIVVFVTVGRQSKMTVKKPL